MKNHQHYIICIQWIMHTYIFCSHQYVKCKTAKNQLNCFYFTSKYIYILPTLSERKRNNGFPYLPFSFNVIIFSTNDWLTQGSNMSKEYNRVLWLFMFLRTSLLCLKKILVPIENVPSQGCQLTYLIIDVTCLQCICFESRWTPIYYGSMEFYAHGHHKYKWSDRILGGHAYCAYLLLMFMTHCPIGLHL